MNSRDTQKAPALVENLLAVGDCWGHGHCQVAYVLVDGSTPMHAWAALTGLGWLLLLSVLLEGGGKGHKGEEVVLGGLGELEVDMIKIHCTDVWNCEKINKIHT